MRLIKISLLFKNLLPKLNVTTETLSNGYIKISKFKDAVSAVTNISDIGIFKKTAETILKNEALSISLMDEIALPKKEADVFISNLDKLKTDVQYLIRISNEIYEEEDLNSVSFKLPENQSLKEVSKTFTDLDMILTQSLVNSYLNGQITIGHFDRGSLWLNIILGSNAALLFLSGLVKLYFDSKERELAIKAKEHAIKDLDLQVGFREEIRTAILAKIDKEDEDSFNKLLDENNIPKDDNEYIERIKHSKDLLFKLLDKGLQVHPAITNNNQNENILPDSAKMIELIKMLPENKIQDKDE